MKNIIIKGILFGLSVFFTIFMCLVGYGSWLNLTTQNPGDTITSTIWNNLINNVNTIGAKVDTLSNTPTGAVMAFNLSSCPTGRIKADGTNGTPDLRGEFIRGLDNGRGVDASRVLGTSQADMLESHNHPFTDGADWRVSGGAGSSYGLGGASRVGTSNRAGVVGYAGGTETRPRNVALLYCVKQ